MSVARLLPLMAISLLLAASAAQAYVQPAFYFLKDAPGSVNDQIPDVPSPIPLPVAIPTIDINPGVLDPYDPKAPNAPNGTTAKSREVPVATDAVLPIQFLTPADHTHPNHIKGPILVGLWTGSSVVYQGNLTATLYEVPAEGDPVVLAEASIDLDFNQSNVPDPTVFVPPNSTDPTVIAFYEVAQLYPVLYHPPALFILGPVDLTFGNDSAFAIGFRMTQGNSPVPAPLGLTSSIEYDGAVEPSFVYVPWYAPDPPRPTTSPRPTYSSTYSRSGSSYSMPTTDSVIEGGKESPGLGLPLSIVALGALAFAVRRRFQ